MSDRDEQRVFINEVCKKEFPASKKRIKVLEYLFDQGDRKVSEVELAVEVFKREVTSKTDLSFVRQVANSLSKGLESFSLTGATTSGWNCALPPQNRGGARKEGSGYSLKWTRLFPEATPTQRFWSATLAGEFDILVVTNEPVFLRYRNELVVRYIDMNAKFDTKYQVLAAMTRAHPTANALWNAPLDRPMKDIDGLHASYIYMLNGEAVARDQLTKWFRSEGVYIGSNVSHHMTGSDMDTSAPILLGYPQTNFLIQLALESREAKNLRYSQWADRFGIKIHHPEKGEIEALETLVPGRFTKTATGVDLNDEQDDVVFGLVTRLQTSSGGAKTIISSDYTRAVGQLATMLTSDSRLGAVIKQLGWGEIPQKFQLLFTVENGSASLTVEGRPPKFICGVKY